MNWINKLFEMFTDWLFNDKVEDQDTMSWAYGKDMMDKF